MQNKGLVRILAVCLALVAAFYLSFSVVTSHYDKKAKEYAGGDAVKEYVYLDSIATKKVWFGYTLKESREKEINLGLDLKPCGVLIPHKFHNGKKADHRISLHSSDI